MLHFALTNVLLVNLMDVVNRFCVAVNVIGFVYAGFQALDLAYYLGKGKHVFAHHLRYHFEFAMDQASDM